MQYYILQCWTLGVFGWIIFTYYFHTWDIPFTAGKRWEPELYDYLGEGMGHKVTVGISVVIEADSTKQ